MTAVADGVCANLWTWRTGVSRRAVGYPPRNGEPSVNVCANAFEQEVVLALKSGFVFTMLRRSCAVSHSARTQAARVGRPGHFRITDWGCCSLARWDTRAKVMRNLLAQLSTQATSCVVRD
jgi:hypothetical protein